MVGLSELLEMLSMMEHCKMGSSEPFIDDGEGRSRHDVDLGVNESRTVNCIKGGARRRVLMVLWR
jgi:hypothetical protein